MSRKRIKALALAAILLQKRKSKKTPRTWIHKFFAEKKTYGEYYTVFCRLKMNLNQETYEKKFSNISEWIFDYLKNLFHFCKTGIFI